MIAVELAEMPLVGGLNDGIQTEVGRPAQGSEFVVGVRVRRHGIACAASDDFVNEQPEFGVLLASLRDAP